MVTFNDSKVLDSASILLSVSTEPASATISSIKIVTHDKFNVANPKESSKFIYTKNFATAVSSYREIITLSEINTSKSLFFIIVELTTGETVITAIYNLEQIYNTMMSYTKELHNSCEIPKDFIDSFLQYKALDLAIITNHYEEAIKFFEKFFLGTQKNKPSKCLCTNGCCCI